MVEWAKNKDRNKKIKELRHNGFSVRDIAKQLHCSKSIVSYHCRNVEMKTTERIEQARHRSQQMATESAKRRWEERRTNARVQAIEEWKQIKKDPILLSLVAFYWAEGTKRGARSHTQSFIVTNSDPGIIRCCLEALDLLGISDIEVKIEIFPEQNQNECKKAWSKFLNRDVDGIREKVWRSNKKKLYSKFGVCVVRVRKSFEIWHKMMSWIDCWRSEFGILESCQL